MFRQPFRVLSVFLMLNFVFTSPVIAGDEGVLDARAVSVTATRVEREVLDVPVSTDVVTQEDIKKSGAGSVAELLRDVPGISVFDNSAPGAKRITIRGESGQRVLVLIDGQKIGEQKSMDGPPLLLSTSDIERIEVIKGPASVLYGSEAVGGVVNIITKKGGDKPVQATLGAKYDSSTSGWEANAAVYGNYKGFKYRISGLMNDHGDRDTPSGKLDKTSYDVRDGRVYLGYENGPMDFGITYERYESTSQVNVPDSTVEAPITSFMLELPKWDRSKFSGYAEYKGSGQYLAKARLDAYHQTTEKDFKQDMGMHIDPPGPISMDNQIDMFTQNEQKTTGGSIQFDWTLGESHYVITGFDFGHDDLDASSKTSTISQRYMMGAPMGPPTTTVTDYNYQANMKTYALYVQDEWNVVDRLIVTLGLRNTWVDSELESTNDPATGAGGKDDSQLVGSAGLVFKVTPDLSFRALFSQGYRFPNLQQLYIGTPHGGAVTYPNKDLKAETSVNYEAGFRYVGNNWNMDVGAFYTIADDYITAVSIGSGLQKFDNVNGAETYGLEFQTSYTFDGSGITPYLSGTIMQRKFEYESFSTYETGQPPLYGRFGLRYNRDFGSNVAFWSDAFMRVADSATEKSSSGTITKYDGWSTVNLAFGVNVGEKRQHRFTAELNNLLDAEYTTATETLPAPGMHAIVKFETNF